jgi:hypothetical protein
MSESKFTSRRRERVLEILRAGGSRRQAAVAAGVDHSTLGDWIAKGEQATPGTRYRDFADAVAEAEGAPPRLVALRREQDSMDADDAIRFLERRGEFAPLAHLPDLEPEVVVLHWPDEKGDR